jgi:hypothetical protein
LTAQHGCVLAGRLGIGPSLQGIAAGGGYLTGLILDTSVGGLDRHSGIGQVVRQLVGAGLCLGQLLTNALGLLLRVSEAAFEIGFL